MYVVDSPNRDMKQPRKKSCGVAFSRVVESAFNSFAVTSTGLLKAYTWIQSCYAVTVEKRRNVYVKRMKGMSDKKERKSEVKGGEKCMGDDGMQS